MNKLRRLILFAIAALLVTTAVKAADSPKFEFRGAWLATVLRIDWPMNVGHGKAAEAQQKKDLEALIDKLYDAGFNAVMFQVRPTADALYRSELEPWSEYLTGERGVAATYDPLEFCIEKCHERGMECHAWINPFRVGKTLPDSKLDRKYKHLRMTHTVGKYTMTILNPAFPETRDIICRVVADIARRYDLDGIVFDDYFYNPEFIPEDKTAMDWKHYQEYLSQQDGSEQKMSMGDWRRNNINETIRLVSETISAIKDGKLRFGLSPQGIAGGNGVYADQGVPSPTDYGVITADSQYGKIYSDPVNWLMNGYIDYISPQIYWLSDNPKHPYGALCHWWNDVTEMYGRHCFPSVTISRFSKDNSSENWDETLLQVETNRESAFNQAPGTIFFAISYISGPKADGFGDYLADSLYTTVALPPAMPWKKAHPLEIKNLHLSKNHLKWDKAEDARYVIYAIPEDMDLLDAIDPSGDGFAPEYIIGITYTNSFTIPDEQLEGSRIAVTPLDRYGNEWQPVFAH